MMLRDTSQHLIAMDALLNQASELCHQGRYAAAEELCQKAVKEMVALFGSSSYKTCECLLHLADVNYAQEKYPEVITLLEQVMVTNRQYALFSEDEALRIKFKLAKAFEKNGNLSESCATYNELIADAERYHGATATFTRQVAQSYASLLRRNESFIADARQLAEDLTRFETRMSLTTTSNNLRTAGNNLTAPSNNLTAPSNNLTAPSNNLRTAFAGSASPGDLSALKASANLRPADAPRAGGRAKILVAACLLALGLSLAGVFHYQSGKHSGAEVVAALRSPSAPDVLLDCVGKYSSSDGVKQLEISESGRGNLTCDGEQQSVTISKVAGEVHAQVGNERVAFRLASHGLIDETGTKLYRSGSPELTTAGSMQRVSSVLNQFYGRYGRYPRSQGELQSLGDRICLVNPLFGRQSFPRLMTASGKSDSSMTLSDYASANWMAANLLSTNSCGGEPGGVELYVFPVSAQGETVIIRGFDRDGQLLPSSIPGKCNAIVLVAGRETE